MLVAHVHSCTLVVHVREPQMGTVSMMMNVETAFPIIGKHAGHLVSLKTLTGENSEEISAGLIANNKYFPF